MSLVALTIETFTRLLPDLQTTFDLALWVQEIPNLFIVNLQHRKCHLDKIRYDYLALHGRHDESMVFPP